MKGLDVSVVIPTFGREKLVSQAVQSVLAQSSRAREIIVVDDGSAPPISLEIGKLARNVRLIRLPVNKGVSHARNVGILAAEAAYVAFLDSDDTWEPCRLELAGAEIGKYSPSEKHIYFDNLVVKGRVISRPPAVIDDPRVLVEGLVSSELLIPTPSLIFHSQWRDILQFDEALQRHEDWDLLISAVVHGFKLINLDTSQVAVRSGALLNRLSTQRDRRSAMRFIQKNGIHLSPGLVAQFEDLNVLDPRGRRLQYTAMVLQYLSRKQVSKGGALARLLMACGLRKVPD
jgi:glycosyltransferase involved in cell wall biosynthesis